MDYHTSVTRRSFSAAQKTTIVQKALSGNNSLASVARDYGVNQNQLGRWIREYKKGVVWKRSVNHAPAYFGSSGKFVGRK